MMVRKEDSQDRKGQRLEGREVVWPSKEVAGTGLRPKGSVPQLWDGRQGLQGT